MPNEFGVQEDTCMSK